MRNLLQLYKLMRSHVIDFGISEGFISTAKIMLRLGTIKEKECDKLIRDINKMVPKSGIDFISERIKKLS